MQSRKMSENNEINPHPLRITKGTIESFDYWPAISLVATRLMIR